jgi:PAP_fibrillin
MQSSNRSRSALRSFAAMLATIAILVTNGSALSTLAPPPGLAARNFFMAPVQRADLKRKIIQAAKQKDEAILLSLVEQLAALNPTTVPTLGLQGYRNAPPSKAPLNGKWKLLYTNARDAEAPARTKKNQRDEPFGDAVASGVQVQTGQRIDAQTGECINFIQLRNGDDDAKLPFDRLDITIQMTPLSDTRVRLDFLKGRVQNPNAPLPQLRDFRFQFPPAAVGDFVARLRGKNPSVEPPAYFDVLYIDPDLRVHRTGEGKIFVQRRDDSR